MKKINIKNLVGSCIAFFIIIRITDYLTKKVWHTEKWYIEFGTMFLFFLLYEIICSFIESARSNSNSSKQFESLEQISEDVLEEIKNLKKSGDTVKAVKMVRDTTDVSLLDAKQFVDRL